MKSQKSDANLQRRSFLLAGSVSAAGAVVAVMAPTAKTVAPVAGAAPKAGDVGYRESDHVRTYYELARV